MFTLDDADVERLAADEPDWLAADRRRALERFRALPIETNQLYTPYVDLRSVDLEATRPFDRSAPDVPDGLHAPELDAAAAAAGVRVESLDAFVAREPERACELLSDDASIARDDRLGQLTRAAWNRGVVVTVPANTVVERPIVLRWAAGTPGRALLTRTIVVLGDGARASIVEELVPAGPDVECAEGETVPQSLFSAATELHLGRGANLALASLQEFGPRQVVFQQRRAEIGDGAELRWALAQLGGRLVRSRVDNVLAGDRSSVEQVEIVFGAEQQVFDLTSYTRHVGRDTTGQLLSKGALLDASRSFMKGLITIEKSAIGTDSYLGEFGMNLSKQARAVAIPSLEIDQPDCRRAAHSSSVGPIDETQLFYLESRGIPPDDARKFIVLGFLEPVVARVPLADAQDRLRDALDAKWEAGWRPEAATAA